MCGRYSLTSTSDVVEEFQLAIGVPPAIAAPRYNIAPTQPAPVIHAAGGARALEVMRWGMLAPWRGHGGKRGPMLINARAEELGGKPIFRDAFARRRCLVPADGFFEWQAHGTQRRPIWFHRDPPHVLALAGIWTTHADDGIASFAILTGPPNALVAPIHDRMPIVVPREAYATWLDPSAPRDAVRALCEPAPITGWRADAVSTRVNSAAHDDAGCIAPADGTPPAQLRLL
jgi:putative SOS response-associated peptidase YedK